MIKEAITKKTSGIFCFNDINKTAHFLAGDISIFLGEEIEELNASSFVFRSGMERALLRVMSILVKKEQKVVIFPDSIPGFTMMTLRKSNVPDHTNITKMERNPSGEIKEFQVLDGVISRYFKKNNQKILLIETEDIIFTLFPLADTRKNLKELEMYVTF